MSNNNSNNSSSNGQVWINNVGWYTINVDNNFIGGDLSGGVEAKTENKKVNKDGCFCKKCKEHYPYAEPNQEDGTLICYGCRNRW